MRIKNNLDNHFNLVKILVQTIIAESRSEEKDIIVKVLVNLINKNN